MRQFDEDKLLERLRDLSPNARAAFAAAATERQLRNPVVLASEAGEAALPMLQPLWDHLLGDPLSEADLEHLAEAAEHLVPRSEEADDWTREMALAENAIASLSYSLRCAATGDPRFAAWAARQAVEALDLHVADQLTVRTYDRVAEEAILTDTLLQSELERQERDLRAAASINASSGYQAVIALRERGQKDAEVFFGG